MANTKSEKLFTEFPPVPTEKWEEVITADLKGADYERKLVWKTGEGFNVRPYYRAENLEGIKFLGSQAGEFPYVRGTHAHNTVVVDGLDQSEYGGSFLWLRDVNCRLIVDAGQTPDRSVHACHDGYLRLPDPVVHHRRVTLAPGGMGLLVEDWLEGTEAHDVELLWHAGARARFSRGPESEETWLLAGERRTLRLALDPGVRTEVIEGRDAPPQGWVSSRFYERVAAPGLSVRGRLLPGQVLQTRIDAVLG